MDFIIGLLRFVLFVDCALLVLLVLIQLPKKEAGLGVAFGGAATDAIFGAGAGNAITHITKWCAVIFFVLSLGIAVADSHYARVNKEAAQKLLLSTANNNVSDTARAATIEAAPVTPASTNITTAPAAAETNAPAATPAPAEPAK